jgi:hypothetical protein
VVTAEKLGERPTVSRAVAVSSTSSPRGNLRAGYCVRNLYATIRATILVKIRISGSDFRIIGIAAA